jgi:hypothetical protein
LVLDQAIPLTLALSQRGEKEIPPYLPQKLLLVPSPLRDDCMDAGGRATSGTVAEKVRMRKIKKLSYIP